MPLENELATFEAMKAELLRNHAGKFALIKDGQFIDAFDSPENAYQVGVNRFGREAFLVKRIAESEDEFRNHALCAGLMHARL